jgi:hypothetical protein
LLNPQLSGGFRTDKYCSTRPEPTNSAIGGASRSNVI